MNKINRISIHKVIVVTLTIAVILYMLVELRTIKSELENYKVTMIEYGPNKSPEIIVNEPEPKTPVQTLKVKTVEVTPLMAEEKVEDTEEVEEVEEENVSYFDVPLDHALQDHIFKLCDEKNIDPAIVIAMIERESRFTTDVIGDNGNSFGLMQIQPRWHQGRMDSLGCTDLLDPYQNVTVGIDLLSELVETEDSIEWALMAYNSGPGLASEYYEDGVITEYVEAIYKTSSNLVRI